MNQFFFEVFGFEYRVRVKKLESWIPNFSKGFNYEEDNDSSVRGIDVVDSDDVDSLHSVPDSFNIEKDKDVDFNTNDHGPEPNNGDSHNSDPLYLEPLIANELSNRMPKNMFNVNSVKSDHHKHIHQNSFS